VMRGIAAAPGVGVGTAYLLHEREVPLGSTSSRASGDSTHPRRTAESELDRFRSGRDVAARYYTTLVDRVRDAVGDEEAEIFEGHLEIITGEDLGEAVEAAILGGPVSAEQAVVAFAEETAKEFEELESEYFQQRAGDIRDLGNRVAEAIYYGSITDPGQIPDRSVIVTVELTPSATARLDTSRVAAIVTEKGGRTSHAAILARSLSIPCVTGVADFVATVRTGQWLVVDGDAGAVELDVDEKTREEIVLRQAHQREDRESREKWARETPAVLADGTPVHLAANVSGAEEASRAAAVGARGSGLVRSEFIFMRYSDFPDRTQQAAEYRAICEALAPEPVVVRLLDCGADKPLPYARQQGEDNPFLGERGIRFLGARPERMREQIAAIAAVHAEGHPIRLMVPMVIDEGEITQARSFLPEGSSCPVGIMVETPASVLRIEQLSAAADFVSIGTNDLIQYVLAVDRGNSRVAGLYDEFHPAVIAAIDTVTTACSANGTHVAVCGDMASHGATALALLALGVEELSAAGTAIPGLKELLRQVSPDDLAQLGSLLRSGVSAGVARAAAEELVQRVATR